MIITWPVPDTDYFCATQAVTSGVPLTLVSPNTIQNIFTNAVTYCKGMPAQNIRNVSLTSSGNLSAVNFTIVGDNGYGTPITQTIAGPNATTVYTSVDFPFGNIYSITPSATSSATVSVGTGTRGNTSWIQFDKYNQNAIYAFTYVVSGSVNLQPIYLPFFTSFVNGKIVYNAQDDFDTSNAREIEFDQPNVYVDINTETLPITQSCSIQTTGIIMGGFSTVVSPSSTGSFVCTVVQQGAKF